MPLRSFAESPLKWDSQQSTVVLWPSDPSAVTEYRFQNTGIAPISILAARPSCDCTSVSFDSSSVPPGGFGKLKATFSNKGKNKDETKLITVAFQPASISPAVLVLNVKINQLASVFPQFTYWKKGESLTPKSVRIAALGTKGIIALPVSTEGGIFSASLKTEETGSIYVIQLSPSSTQQLVKATIQEDIRDQFGHTQRVQFYAAVVD